MADWVLGNARYEANIAGGNLQNHKVSVSVYRERKNKYTVTVDISPPGGSRSLGLGGSLRDAALFREFTKPETALDAGFRSLWRHLNNNGKNTLQELVQSSAYWEYLDETGKTDWEFMDKLGDKERAEKTNQPFKYTPPTSEAIRDNSKAKQTGRAFDMTAELSGLDESGRDVKVGGEAATDGVATAKKGLNRFLQSRGMGPSIDDGSDTEAPEEDISVPGQNGPKNGATLAIEEPSSPV